MLWHLVRFDLSGLDLATRVGIEDRLRGFDRIPHVAAVRVGPDPERPGFTTLLVAFRERPDLGLYRVHPDHLAFSETLRQLDIPRVGIDLETDDEPALFGSVERQPSKGVDRESD